MVANIVVVRSQHGGTGGGHVDSGGAILAAC